MVVKEAQLSSPASVSSERKVLRRVLLCQLLVLLPHYAPQFGDESCNLLSLQQQVFKGKQIEVFDIERDVQVAAHLSTRRLGDS